MTTAHEEAPVEHETIWRALDEWGNALAGWQRYILACAVREGRLSDDEIDDCYQLFLHANNMAVGDQRFPEVPSSVTGRTGYHAHPPIRLIAVRNLQNVNAIPPTAALTFGDSLNVVYGGTGTGKSGFARVLAAACFSRSRPRILPNVYAENAEGDPSAEIVIQEGNKDKESITFTRGNENPTLRRVSIFDSFVARIHLSEQNPLGFQPVGFDVFPEMTRVIGKIGERLDKEISARDRENAFTKSFLGESAVSRAMAALGPDADLDSLRAQAVFGSAEEARAVEVDRQLQELRRTSPEEVLKTLAQAKADITTLERRLEGLLFDALGTGARDAYQQQLEELRARVSAAAAAGARTFGRTDFRQIGTPVWEGFITAAKVLAASERDDYPREGDPCLLCHRPLDEPSATLIRRFWAFLGDELAERSRKQTRRLI